MTTKMDIANTAADIAVSAVARQMLTTVITKNTEKNEDDFVVVVVSAFGAWYISERMQPHTHAAVEKVVNKLKTIRDNYRNPEQA